MPPTPTPASKPSPRSSSAAKITQALNPDGSVTFTFPTLSPFPLLETFHLPEFPAPVLAYFASLGMRTKLRNFTVPKDPRHPPTAEQMHADLLSGAARLRAGRLRSPSPAHSTTIPTLVLEASLIYRQMKAEKEGRECTDTIASIIPLLETMRTTLVSPLDNPTPTATPITQYDLYLTSPLYKLALATARARRSAQRVAALQSQTPPPTSTPF